MSYNIDRVEYLNGELSIRRAVAQEIQHDEKWMAEDNFLDYLPLKGDPNELLPIKRPSWRGEHSGGTYDYFKEILSLTYGKADLLLTWEGGDSHTGLRVADGIVTEKKVVQVLE